MAWVRPYVAPPALPEHRWRDVTLDPADAER